MNQRKKKQREKYYTISERVNSIRRITLYYSTKISEKIKFFLNNRSYAKKI